MFDVLRFKADTPVTRVSAALARTPARKVALVFPLGASVTIADAAALASLSARTAKSHKSVTIVGGDTHLRACAITAGFAAATTIEDWRAAGEDLASEISGAYTPALTLLDGASAPCARAAHTPDDNATWELDPPPYIARLLAPEAQVEGHVFVAADSSGRLRALPPPSDAAAYLAALRASERHEEDISDAIRETSGFKMEEWESPASRAAGDSDFGESRHP
jgi:hypothetical protein